ncbi:MAG: GGDEF domain-containing protein [Ruminococcus sp.]|nr:GGDEF domain-containing protein [Ruminococcus sp.]
MLHGYKLVAVCLTKVHEDTMRNFISSLSSALHPHKWRVLVYATPSDLFYATDSDKGAETVFDLITEVPIDAAIVFADRIMDPACRELICKRVKEKNVPLFLIDGQAPDCYSIQFDFETGFAKMIHHLIDCHNIKKFHMISGIKGNEFSDQRELVMKRVLEEASIPFDDTMISYGGFWSVPAIQATERLIERDAVPEAIVCSNDTMAIAVSTTLMQHGYRIPEDVIVTGFDGIDAIHFTAPKITSCVCCFETLGKETAQFILNVDHGVPCPKKLLVEPQLVLLESCGCVPLNSLDAVDYINMLGDCFNRYKNEEQKLNEVFAKIQSCKSIEDIPETIDIRLVYDMCCLLKTECTDPTLNPLTVHSSSTFGEQLYVLLDTDVNNEIEERTIPLSAISPRIDHLLHHGTPLIFVALHCVDIPLGYLCFHYFNTDIGNYQKIAQTASYLSMAISGFRHVQHQRYLTSVVEDLYQYDALTGLFNRNRFLRRYQQMVDEGAFEHITIVLCDLDGLKYINDTFSHHEGDNAISVVAEALRTVCRDGLSCRYGGDELVAVLPNADDPDYIRTRILDHLHTYNQWAKKPYEVSASIGVYTTTDSNFESMFASADALMYQDKLGKKHRRK